MQIRDADLVQDLDAIRGLWLEYLAWGNDEMDRVHGFRLPVHEAVERDTTHIAKFAPPSGCIVLAVVDDRPVGIACMQRIGPVTAELKRMYVQPAHRGGGLASRMLDRLLERARGAGYASIRLDSPDFMGAAHALYRARGFTDGTPYPESEIPDEFKQHWVFMERSLA